MDLYISEGVGSSFFTTRLKNMLLVIVLVIGEWTKYRVDRILPQIYTANQVTFPIQVNAFTV